MKIADPLSVYTGVKLQLASVLQNLLRFAQERKDEERARFIQELLGDLAEDNFRLAIFGKYNRGKSTLMNALLGMERLPTGILPLTSVVTTVRYDSREHVLIFRKGWSLPQDISMEQLVEYVTENGNPGNEKKVALAQVFLPADILRNGFFLIDTPGVGSGITANTKAAEAFIPRADAAIVVMSVESPLDQEDLRLLERVRAEVGKVYVVLNKTDIVQENEQKNVTRVLESRLEELFGEPVPVFPLSARNANAQRKNTGVAATDLDPLIETLLAFVRSEKTGQFLKRMAERTRALIRDERTLDYLVRRNSLEKDEILRRVQQQADSALTDGKKELNKLLASVEGESAAFLQPYLLECERMTWSVDAVPSGDNATTGVELQSVLPDYAETIARLNNRLQEVKDAAGPALLIATDEDSQLGASVASSEVFRPAPFRRTGAQRFWKWIGAARMPDLRRILIEPGFEQQASRLTRRVQQTLKQRIELVEEKYVVAIRNILDRIRVALSRAPRSAHTQALDKLEGELQQAMRMATESHEIRSTPPEPVRPDAAPIEGNCVLCEHLVNIQFHFLRQYQYRLSVDPEERVRNAEWGGLCAFHTWMYEGISSPQGVCSGYASVPLRLAHEIDRLLPQNVDTDGNGVENISRAVLQRLEQCVACELLKSAEADKVAEILANDEALKRTPLCIPHLCRIAATESARPSALERFAQMAAALRNVGEDMQKFALKQGGLRYGWTSTRERNAHIDALKTLVGVRQLAYIKTIVEI